MIYLDHSATTPLDKRVYNKMKPYFTDDFGNASSIHSYGQKANNALESARGQVADFVGGNSNEIIFTSGATESDNLAVFGVAEKLRKDGQDLKDLHFITTSVEHPAVEEPFLKLKEQGAQVTFLPVQSNGVIDLEEIKSAIQDNTVLISIVYVNSEVGAKQPVKEIGKIIKEERRRRSEDKAREEVVPRGRATSDGRGATSMSEDWTKNQVENILPLVYHTDAVQAANFFDCNVDELGVDLMSLSGHKVYGPKGVGALYVRSGTKLIGQQIGGHQENNLRSGTYNIPGVVGIGEALELTVKERDENNKHLEKLQRKLIEGIQEKIPQAYLSTDTKVSTPSHIHFSFPGAEGEAVLLELDMDGVCVSTGSACASTSLKSSSTLLAMGVPKEVTHGAIRMTLGKNNTEEDVNKVLKILPKVIAKYRAMSPKNIDYGGTSF